MTGLGQSRRSDHVVATSGLPRGTDIAGPIRYVAEVPARDSRTAKHPFLARWHSV